MPAQTSTLAVVKGSGELVLLVDDEDNIRGVLRQTLERHNYRVEAARDGAEASAVFARHAADVKLVVTEIDMLYLDGDSKAAEERVAQLKELGVKTVLAKPYTAEKILKAVHRAITGGVKANARGAKT